MTPKAPRDLTPQSLRSLLDFCAGLDLTKSGAARSGLESEFPFNSTFVQGIGQLLRGGVAAGRLCDRGEPPVQYSRLFKSSDEPTGFSADVVLMTAPGPMHRHPNGEVDLCFAEEGNPTFDGQPPGWLVYPPDSKHVPTVAGGKMLILYLLPEGAIEFLKDEKA